MFLHISNNKPCHRTSSHSSETAWTHPINTNPNRTKFENKRQPHPRHFSNIPPLPLRVQKKKKREPRSHPRARKTQLKTLASRKQVDQSRSAWAARGAARSSAMHQSLLLRARAHRALSCCTRAPREKEREREEKKKKSSISTRNFALARGRRYASPRRALDDCSPFRSGAQRARAPRWDMPFSSCTAVQRRVLPDAHVRTHEVFGRWPAEEERS